MQRFAKLKELRPDISKADLARATGAKPPSVGAWFDGGTLSMKGETAAKAAALYGVTAHWLATGEGPMYPQHPAEASPTAIPIEDNPEYPAIRRVRFKLSAGASGYGIEYLDPDQGAPIVFQRSWYENRGFRPDKLFATKVANGSMEPGLNHDDTVVVNTESAQPKDGVVFAANYEGEMVIKRLVRDAGEWWLSSDNPDQRRYPRKVCHADTFIIGEVVHKQSERI